MQLGKNIKEIESKFIENMFSFSQMFERKQNDQTI